MEPMIPPPEKEPEVQLVPAHHRLWMIFTSPGEVFRSISIRPSWGLVLLAIVLLTIAVQFVTVRHLDLMATIQQSMAERGRELSDEQLQTIVERGQRFNKYQPFFIAGVVPLVMVIVAAFYFITLKISGSDTDFMRTFSTTLHAYWPASLVKGLLFLVLVQRVGKLTGRELEVLVRSNVASFLGDTAPAWLRSIGTTLDIFNVWVVVLLVMGFQITAGLNRKQSLVAVLGLWAFYLAFKAGIALIFR